MLETATLPGYMQYYDNSSQSLNRKHDSSAWVGNKEKADHHSTRTALQRLGYILLHGEYFPMIRKYECDTHRRLVSSIQPSIMCNGPQKSILSGSLTSVVTSYDS